MISCSSDNEQTLVTLLNADAAATAQCSSRFCMSRCLVYSESCELIDSITLAVVTCCTTIHLACHQEALCSNLTEGHFQASC